MAAVGTVGLPFLPLPALAASGLFPKMPAGTNVFVADCQKDSVDARMAAWALQGLVNRSLAEAYVIEKEKPRRLEQLKDCGRPFELLDPPLGANAGCRSLFAKYRGHVKKLFVFDLKKDWTVYLAVMAAAQQDGIPVSEPLRKDLAEEFGWNGEVEDFRDRWPNRIAAYDWALAHLMPRCNRKVVFATPVDTALFDYAVACQGFVFWLDFDKERAEVQKVFRTPGYGVGTSLMGYSNTGDEANAVSNPFGIGYVTSDLYANGSFWSSFPNKTYRQAPGKVVPAEPGKIYASIMWSDGDNIQFDQGALYNLWHDPVRGTIPVATQLAPALQELNTPLLDWFYAKLTDQDELVAGPTGFQFIFIRDFNERLFPSWCALNRRWCADAGFHAARIWIAPKPGAKYSLYMKSCGLAGVLGEGWGLKSGFPPRIETYGAANEEELFRQFLAVKPDPKVPVFVNFTPIVAGLYQEGHGYTAIKRQMERLEQALPGRYVFLLPKDQFATIQAYFYLVQAQAIEGRPGAAGGLTIPVKEGDGAFELVNRDGVACWKVPRTKNLYVDVPDTFRPLPGKMLEIGLDYFDAGSGEIVLEYDSADIQAPLGGAYKKHPLSAQRRNTGQWQQAGFRTADAGFGGLQNGGADFRFYNGGDDLLIRAVRVRRVAP